MGEESTFGRLWSTTTRPGVLCWRAGTREDLFFVEVATVTTDCLEPLKGETLEALLGVTSKLLPVEGGIGERKNLEFPPDAE